MLKIVAFAIFSTRRMDEIARIIWEDLDEHRQAVKVRDMKNPEQEIGLEFAAALHPSEGAWRSIFRMELVGADYPAPVILGARVE
ncbi:hypothetical protein STW0522PSE72_16110 [Pseudomonas monteilii]|nr:hypothetical protein STW0522PSE72_16110 [Pseudomonas monteilii]